MRSEGVDVAVIVVAYNDRDALHSCVTALVSDSAPAHIVVVDNASDDGTASILEGLAAVDERITIQANRENIGYAAAVTAAAGLVESTYLAILNADTLPSVGWLEPQIVYLDRNPDVAATCPTLALKGTDLLNAAGQDIHVTGLGFNRFLSHPIAASDTSPVHVPGLQGTAFVIRRSVLEAMGGWYSGGFLYHEDVELSWTLRLMGHEIAYVPTPRVEHDYTLTMSPEKLFLLERNRWELLLASTRPSTRLILSPLLVWTELMMWGYCLMRGPSMLTSKGRTYASIRRRRAVVRERRAQIDRLRRVSDRAVMRSFRWNYNWDQLVFVGRSRSTSGRR
ncbi:MAG: glycosyltransferase, partial [Acidimicrobiia bacterium]|nr:glycosyltransferase [Acidimicrobiia bacterium]